jgi:hypothetical protein
MRKEPSLTSTPAAAFSIATEEDELDCPAILKERPSMDIRYGRNISAFAAAALLLLSLSLGDCPTETAGSSLNAMAQATPPKKSIFDPLPQREPAMTRDEQQKMQKELNGARDRQTPNAKAKAHPVPPAQPTKP